MYVRVTSWCVSGRAHPKAQVIGIAIVAYLALVNDNALWIWQIDSSPFQIINRLCAVV